MIATIHTSARDKEWRMGEQESPGQPVKPQLGTWDAVSIIIGIVIGSTIYKTPPIIFQNVSSPWMGMGVWLLGGALALVGALCYSELATTYPRSGGDYVYLTRAYGAPVGFLFGWAQLAVILTGSIGAMAFIFGDYAVDYLQASKLLTIENDRKEEYAAGLAIGAVVVLSVTNILGVLLGKVVQNLLTAAKVLGLGAIVVAGFFYSPAGAYTPAAWDVKLPINESFGVAMILVFYAYGGWNDAAFVAADMKDTRNIPRALVLGVGIITLVYLAVNAAYLLALGFEGARQFRPVAADVLRGPLGDGGFKVMCLVVMVSALGAINGLIFTGSRVYTSLGSEHSVFTVLGRWNKNLGAPLWSLLIQAIICVAMIFLVGMKPGREAIDSLLTGIGLDKMPWDRYFGGFDTLFAGTAPVFWLFFLLTGISLFILRAKDPTIERPFKLRAPFYPLLPLIFCGMCAYGLYSASMYAKYVSLIGIVPLVIGIPLYFVSSKRVSSET